MQKPKQKTDKNNRNQIKLTSEIFESAACAFQRFQGAQLTEKTTHNKTKIDLEKHVKNYCCVNVRYL